MRVIGIDLAAGGDNSAMCIGHINDKGNFVIDKILTGKEAMKKVKKVKLTKDQKEIVALKAELLRASQDKSDAEYRMRQAQNAQATAENDLTVRTRKNEATQRKLELVTSEVVATAQLLETTAHDISREQSQRILGIAQGRLTAAAMLTDSWTRPDHYNVKGRM